MTARAVRRGRLSLMTPWSEGEHIACADKSYRPVISVDTPCSGIGAWNWNLVFDLGWWYWWFLYFAVLDLWISEITECSNILIYYVLGRNRAGQFFKKPFKYCWWVNWGTGQVLKVREQGVVTEGLWELQSLSSGWLSLFFFFFGSLVFQADLEVAK